jgi:tetratricopeptide (TPR) repeat protein
MSPEQALLAERRYDKAIESFLMADREFRDSRTVDSLATAYQAADDRTQAIATYPTLLATPSLGWEGQQPWLAAHYGLASEYRRVGQAARSRETADALLVLWKDADPDLPLLKQTREFVRTLAR